MQGSKWTAEEWNEIVEKVLELIRAGLTVPQACAVMGINKSTMYRRMKRSKKLATRIQAAKDYYIAWIKTEMYQLYEKIKDGGDLKTALKHMEYLAEKRASDEFKSRNDVDITSEGKPIKQYEVKIIEPEHKKNSKIKKDGKRKQQSRNKGNASSS